ncbi:MAG: hypothetical protein II420_01525, partial [Oscillospiraceae bacterium]|nr:hypothetical protein [Oscillospiraceae bacterium]
RSQITFHGFIDQTGLVFHFVHDFFHVHHLMHQQDNITRWILQVQSDRFSLFNPIDFDKSLPKNMQRLKSSVHPSQRPAVMFFEIGLSCH